MHTQSDAGRSARRKLPIGIQTFRKIREENCYYVDKTAYIARLVDEGTHYFLSRPRRFGKSLFLDTIKELFEGNEPLFEGLAIHPRWDWSVRHPVLRLDFSSGHFKEPGDLHKDVMAQLDAMESEAAVTVSYDTAAVRLRNLLKTLHQQTGQRVAVLIDEYDKPILDALAVPEVARANRDFLHGLYSTIKFGDAHLKFSFLTGVSKFSKVSLFSGLNNLIDITLDPLYSAICGYTEADLDAVFAPELLGLDRDEIRTWYNGYNWLGEEAVYNPFDVLLLFRRRAFAAYWFETGTPTFLLETLLARGISALALDDLLGSEELLSAFDVDHIAPEALLFQTGYLTIRRTEPRGGRMYYRLGYPNREVQQSLNESLLNYLTDNPARRAEHSARLYDLLLANDFEGLERLLEGFFASIPYEWHTNNEIAHYEGYYASVFYSYFASLGLAITVEDSSQAGRLDMAVEFNENVYLFEFKVVEQAATGAALGQVQARDYAAKYRGRSTAIYLIGVEFSRQTRNLAAFAVERA
ncbi:MAG: ATP-binding protein [Gemmatimonadetes bacterium]|nr:ATP-binding protein [Gemmatimonadota bacterium]